MEGGTASTQAAPSLSGDLVPLMGGGGQDSYVSCHRSKMGEGKLMGAWLDK